MRRTDSQTAAYPIRSQEPETGISFPQFPVVNQSNTAYPAPSDGTAPLALGQAVVDRHGFLYLYVHTTGALAVGEVCTFSANVTEGAIQAPDTVADNIHVLTTDLAGISEGVEIGNFLHIGNTTGSIGDLKVIKDNTATVGGTTYFTISRKQIFQGRGGYDGDAPAAAYAAAGSEVSLIRPYRVVRAVEANEPVGIAMGTVTSGNCTLIQIEGLAQVSGVAGTTFVDNALVYTKAAGQVSVTAGTGLIVGRSKSAYAGANSVLVPVWLTDISSNW